MEALQGIHRPAQDQDLCALDVYLHGVHASEIEFANDIVDRTPSNCVRSRWFRWRDPRTDNGERGGARVDPGRGIEGQCLFVVGTSDRLYDNIRGVIRGHIVAQQVQNLGARLESDATPAFVDLSGTLDREAPDVRAHI